jgi:hypothetical protein
MTGLGRILHFRRNGYPIISFSLTSKINLSTLLSLELLVYNFISLVFEEGVPLSGAMALVSSLLLYVSPLH